jgi:tetratricopeptide (TPR) repeat protein
MTGTVTTGDWREDLAKLQTLVHGGKGEGESEDDGEVVLEGDASSTQLALGILEADYTESLPDDVTLTVTTLYIRLLLQQAEEESSGDNNNKAFDVPLNFIRNKAQHVHTSSKTDNFYAAEEAYCLYRKKQYAKARAVCETVLELDGGVALNSAVSVSSPEGVLHVYAQTLYRLSQFDEAQQVYSKLQSDATANTAVPVLDEAEIMTNSIAAAACSNGPEVLGELERSCSTNRQVAAMMKGKQRLADIYSSDNGNENVIIPYDLAYNVATAMAMHGTCTQDLQTAASLLMQAQQACKATLEADEEDAGDIQAELAPLQCNQAYALLKQSQMESNGGDADKKKRLAEAFLNKVMTKSKGGSAVAATAVAAHNIALVKALSVSGSGGAGKNNKSNAKAIEEALKLMPDPLLTSTKLTEAQVIQMLQNKALLLLQHGHQDADCLAVVKNMRKYLKQSVNGGGRCAEADLVEACLLDKQGNSSDRDKVSGVSWCGWVSVLC